MSIRKAGLAACDEDLLKHMFFIGTHVESTLESSKITGKASPKIVTQLPVGGHSILGCLHTVIG